MITKDFEMLVLQFKTLIFFITNDFYSIYVIFCLHESDFLHIIMLNELYCVICTSSTEKWKNIALGGAEQCIEN